MQAATSLPEVKTETPTRSYGQFCGIARALDLVGERWALLVVRDLILGPKRFTDLQQTLPGIGTNVLSTRLKQLEEAGVISRRTLPPPAASSVYELTDYGRELEEILLALGRWGAKSLSTRGPEQTLRSGWIGVAMRAYASAATTPGLDATYELRLDHGVLRVAVEGGEIHITEGVADHPDLVVETQDETLIAMLAGALPVDEAVASGLVSIEGDEALLHRLVEIVPFGIPESVAKGSSPS